MGIEEEVESMKSRIQSASDVLANAKSSLEKLKEIEDEVEAALEPKRQNLRELFGEPEDEPEDWKLLNPKFSQDDLKGKLQNSHRNANVKVRPSNAIEIAINSYPNNVE